MPWPTFQKSLSGNYSISSMKMAVGVHGFEYYVLPLLSLNISTNPFLKINWMKGKCNMHVCSHKCMIVKCLMHISEHFIQKGSPMKEREWKLSLVFSHTFLGWPAVLFCPGLRGLPEQGTFSAKPKSSFKLGLVTPFLLDINMIASVPCKF